MLAGTTAPDVPEPALTVTALLKVVSPPELDRPRPPAVFEPMPVASVSGAPLRLAPLTPTSVPPFTVNGVVAAKPGVALSNTRLPAPVLLMETAAPPSFNLPGLKVPLVTL